MLELADKVRDTQRIPVGNTLSCIYKFKCGAVSNLKKFLASISDNEFLHTLVQQDQYAYLGLMFTDFHYSLT